MKKYFLILLIVSILPIYACAQLATAWQIEVNKDQDIIQEDQSVITQRTADLQDMQKKLNSDQQELQISQADDQANAQLPTNQIT